MSKDALALKYRPKKIGDLVGQDHVRQVLTNSIKGNKYHHSYIFAGNLGCGKCITGDSIVCTPNGLRRISSIVPSDTSNNMLISTINEPVFDETGVGISEYGYFEKNADTIFLQTSDGFSIEGTREHPIRCLNANGDIVWKRIDQISIGDILPVVRNDCIINFRAKNIVFNFCEKEKLNYASNKFKNSSSINSSIARMNSLSLDFVPNKQFARSVGYIVAEAHVSDNKFSLSNTDESMVNEVSMAFENLGISFSKYSDKRRDKEQKIISSSSSCFSEFLKSMDLNNLSADKVIPEFVLEWPRDLLIEFLRGYFEGDGGLDGNRVSACSISEKLIYDIQRILLSFGILSRVSFRKKKCANSKNKDKEFDAWQISITGQDINIFAEKIGFISERKQDKLLELCEKTSGFRHFDILPGWMSRLVDMKSSLPITKSGKIKVNQKWVCAPRWQGKVVSSKEQNATYNIMQKALIYFKEVVVLCRNDGCLLDVVLKCEKYINLIERVISSNYYYSSVSKIENRKSDVYDLCKSKSDHSFFANGFINHNTSAARIFAASVNNPDGATLEPDLNNEIVQKIFLGKHADVKEIDAASNGSIDNIRDIKQSIQYNPIECRRRFVIIDESHRLSGAAAEAALKMIEEPPENCIFILCTTEADKLKDTIQSRCLSLRFNKVSWNLIFQHLKNVADAEGMTYEERALRIAARKSKGSIRNALQNLQMLSTFSPEGCITADIAKQALYAVDESHYFELVDAIMKPDAGEAMLIIDSMIADGRDVGEVMDGLVGHIRNLLIIITCPSTKGLLFMTEDEVKRYVHQLENLPGKDKAQLLLEMFEYIAEASRGIALNLNPQTMFEAFVVKAIIQSQIHKNSRMAT